MKQINSLAQAPDTERAPVGRTSAVNNDMNWRMMTLTMRLMLPVLIALVITGCGNEGKVEDLSNDIQTVAAQMTLGIDADPTVAGATKAHDNLNSKRKSLLEKWDKLKVIKLSPTEKTRLLLAISDSRKEMASCAAKHTDQRLVSQPFNEAMESLIKDFETSFNPADLQ